MNNQPCLVIIAGPTAIGKTSLTIDLAEHFHSEIISADSRQVFKELIIGTARPSEKELAQVPHHLVGSINITTHYSVADYEHDALSILGEIYKSSKLAFLTGGSGLYIQAVCEGLDDVPAADPILRERLNSRLKNVGIEDLANELSAHDPEAASKIDLKNPQRVIRALEIIHATGRKLSEMQTGNRKQRPFRLIKILLDMDREMLYERINQRVDNMMAEGLMEEARNLFNLRHLNALQTVGYKELFDHFEGKTSLEKAVDMIKQNTRRYAKRQLTWFRNKDGFTIFHPDDKEEIIKHITSCCGI